MKTSLAGIVSTGPPHERHRAFSSGRSVMALIGLAVLAVATRGSAIGVTVTGLMIGGAAYFWQQVLGFFAGLTRKLGDEAASLENDGQLRRVA